MLSKKKKKLQYITTAHPWCDDYFTSINACKMWGARTGVEIFMREFHTHILLD